MQTNYQSYQHASQYTYFPAPYGAQGQCAPGYVAQVVQGQAMSGRRTILTNLGQGADFSHMGNSFPGARMASGNLQGEQGLIESTYGAPFVQAQGKNILT